MFEGEQRRESDGLEVEVVKQISQLRRQKTPPPVEMTEFGLSEEERQL